MAQEINAQEVLRQVSQFREQVEAAQAEARRMMAEWEKRFTEQALLRKQLELQIQQLTGERDEWKKRALVAEADLAKSRSA